MPDSRSPNSSPSSTDPHAHGPATGTSGADGRPKKKRRRKKRPHPGGHQPVRVVVAPPPETPTQKWILRVGMVLVFLAMAWAAKVWLIDKRQATEQSMLAGEYTTHSSSFRRLYREGAFEIRGVEDIVVSPESAEAELQRLPAVRDLFKRAMGHYQQAVAYANEWFSRYDEGTPGHDDLLADRRQLDADYRAFLEDARRIDELEELLTQVANGQAEPPGRIDPEDLPEDFDPDDYDLDELAPDVPDDSGDGPVDDSRAPD